MAMLFNNTGRKIQTKKKMRDKIQQDKRPFSEARTKEQIFFSVVAFFCFGAFPNGSCISLSPQFQATYPLWWALSVVSRALTPPLGGLLDAIRQHFTEGYSGRRREEHDATGQDRECPGSVVWVL